MLDKLPTRRAGSCAVPVLLKSGKPLVFWRVPYVRSQPHSGAPATPGWR